MLNEYEQKKYDTISKFVSKEINLRETMNLLNLTERQIYRLKKYMSRMVRKDLFIKVVVKQTLIKKMIS